MYLHFETQVSIKDLPVLVISNVGEHERHVTCVLGGWLFGHRVLDKPPTRKHRICVLGRCNA